MPSRDNINQIGTQKNNTSEKNKEVTCLYLNIQGLTSNIDLIKIVINESNPKIVFLSETHITENIEESEIYIQGYNLVQCLSDSRHTGGVLMYIKANISYSVVSSTMIDRNWLLAVRITKGFTPGIYGVIYHSPNGNHNLFIESFENWCDDVLDLSTMNMITGDFNINWIKNDYISDKLKSLCNYLYLKQKVSDYTRISKYSKTLIDLVLTNNTNLKVEMVDSLNVSDHREQYIFITVVLTRRLMKSMNWKR